MLDRGRRGFRRQVVARAESWLGPVVKRVLYVLAFDVLVRDMATPVPRNPHHPDVVLRRIGKDQSPWWEVPLKRRRAAKVRAAVAEGDIGCVALVGDRIVGEVWATPVTKGDVRVTLAPGEAYSYGLQTDKRYRHLGTATAVMSGLLDDLRQESVSRVYGVVDRRNRPSQVLLRTFFGFRQVQRARRVRVLRRWGFVVPGSAAPREGPLSRHRGA